jgi:outer membrane protein TolC
MCSIRLGPESNGAPRIQVRGRRSDPKVRPCIHVCLVLWLTTASAFAQTPVIPKVEFDEAIQRAVANNPTIAQAATAIAHAGLLVQQARAVTLPTASARATNLTLNSEVGFNGLVTQPQNQSTFAGDLTVPVLDLTRWAAVPQAQDQVKIAELSTDATRRDIAIATAQAYLTIVVSRRQLEVDQRALDNARAHMDYAQRRLQAGGGSQLNELRAASSASTSELRLENSRLALRRAQEALGVLLAADSAIDAGAEPAFDVPTVINEQDWMQARADVRVQQATQAAGERIVHDSWRDWLGTAAASFDPQYVVPKGLFQPSKTWRLTATFTQPIFEGGQRKVVRQLRELQVQQTKIALSNVMLRARSEVRIAQEAIRSSTLALENARTAAAQADDVLRITNAAFEVGATTNIEVIDAQRSARDAETTAALAEDALRRARLDLLVAIGKFPR